MDYNYFVCKLIFVGFAVLYVIYSILIASKIVEPLSDVTISCVCLCTAGYITLDYYKLLKEKHEDLKG